MENLTLPKQKTSEKGETMRKNILIAIIASSLFLNSSQAFALFNFSAGVPLSHSFADTDVAESDGVSGVFIQVGLPLLPGVGMDSYKTKIKDSEIHLATMIYNLYYLLPIPIINLTVGGGIGSTELECTVCSDAFDKGNATQWYASFGFPIIPLFDLHLSYRSVSTKIKRISDNQELDLSGNVMGLGIGFNF